MFCDSDIVTGSPLHLLHNRGGVLGDPNNVCLDIVEHRTWQDRVDMVDNPRSFFGLHHIFRCRRNWPAPVGAVVDSQICVQGSGLGHCYYTPEVLLFFSSFLFQFNKQCHLFQVPVQKSHL